MAVLPVRPSRPRRGLLRGGPRAATALAAVLLATTATTALGAQVPAPPPARSPADSARADSARTAARLDVEGRTGEARAIFTALVASAPDEAARAQARRALAMSYAFAGDCGQVERLEQQAIAYWRTREAAEPQNAFYQEGELANEAARVCLDAGRLDDAERLYRLGRALGLKEPEPRTHPAALWEFRTAHALARLAARRGQADSARAHVEAARRLLDADTAMARAQRRFLPYLEGYVALYTGDPAAAERHFTAAVAMPGNERDPYYRYLLGEAYEREGKTAEARGAYEQAYALATAHNPPAAFVRPAARRKLGDRSGQ